ncbi:hypothetical protein ACFWIA_16065 [Streptomyces sp. NPDC127068]
MGSLEARRRLFDRPPDLSVRGVRLGLRLRLTVSLPVSLSVLALALTMSR